MKKKKVSLERGQKSISVKVYENKYEEKNRDLKRINKEILEIEENIEVLKKSNIKAKEEFLIQQNKEKEREKLIRDIDETIKLKKRVLEYEESITNSKKFTIEVELLKSRIKEIDLTSKINNDKINIINNEIEEILLAKDKKGKLEVDKVKYTTKISKLDTLVTSINQWNINFKKYSIEKLSFEKLEKQFKEEKIRTETIEDILRKSQAGLLALGLKEEEECPVCGSCTHPKLAKLENIEITEESVKNSKISLEKSRSIKEDKLRELTDINSTLKSIKENSIKILIADILKKELISSENINIKEYKNIQEIKKDVIEVLNNNNSTLLEIQNNIEELNNIIKKEKDKISEKQFRENENYLLKEELRSKNEILIESEGSLRVINSNLDNIKNEFKGEIRSLKELNLIENTLNIEIQKLKHDYNNAEINFNTSKTLLDQELGSYNKAKQVQVLVNKELKNALEIFKEKVLDLNFKDYKDYKSSILSELEIEILNKEINDFNTKLSTARNLYESSLKDIEGKVIIDLTLIQSKLNEENKLKLYLLEESKEVFSRIKNNELVIKSCEKYNKEISIDENEYKIVGKLSNIVNGDNIKRISFERYVLAAYFEDIINAANIRFNKMTSNRFELLRKQIIGDMRKGQGLDLEVFDNYTGKARDIKTLSGGESFKASLAMALGLADIVQAHSGGIQLDTMFIDEGLEH